MELVPQGRITAAGLSRWINECSVFVSDGKGIIEMIEQCAAGDDKIPRFGAIRQVVGAAKAGFIVANRLIELPVHRGGIGWRSIMKIENRNGWMRIGDRGLAIRNVPGNKKRLRPGFHRISENV